MSVSGEIGRVREEYRNQAMEESQFMMKNIDYITDKLRDVEIPECPGLDQRKVREYLELLSGKQHRLVKSILDNTIHLKTREITKRVKENVREFLGKIHEDFSVIFNFSLHIGSELYYFSKIVDELKESPYYKGVCDAFSCDTNTVVRLDDASFSGANAVGALDELMYNTGPKKVYIIIPYQTVQSVDLINDIVMNFYHSNVVFTKYEILPKLSDLIHGSYDELIDLTMSEGDPSPVFFDHKVPGPQSSFPGIYLHGYINKDKEYGSLFIRNPDRGIFHELEDDLRSLYR